MGIGVNSRINSYSGAYFPPNLWPHCATDACPRLLASHRQRRVHAYANGHTCTYLNPRANTHTHPTLAQAPGETRPQ